MGRICTLAMLVVCPDLNAVYNSFSSSGTFHEQQQAANLSMMCPTRRGK